jgi:hypothetical protein
MKIERSPQGISFQCKTSIGHYVFYLVVILFSVYWARGWIDFLAGFLTAATSDPSVLGIKVVLFVLIALVFWQWIYRALRELVTMEVRSGLFEFSTRLLTLQLQNGFGQKQVLNCGAGDVQDVELFYSNVSDEGEGYCGLRLKLAQVDLPLYLSRGGMPLKQARSIAKELESQFGLPEKPPLYGHTGSSEGEMKSRLLEKTEHRLVYRLDYGAFVIKLYALVGLFAIFFLSFPVSAMAISPAPLLVKIVMLGIGSIPMGLLLWLMQNVGFYETWTWERSSKQFKSDRKLLIGMKKQVFPRQGVKTVVLRTQPGTLITPTYYQVGLNAPTLNLGQVAGTKNPVRVIYSNQNLSEATDFAEELRYYLNLGDALS